ncbi:carbonic anhydrase [Aquabacterium sp.]|uniref:carbonic anhydrase n=1 Tax=Aquabacterium sp. TaxID=1872578 RepID=UPI0027BA718E|nr:carbonic anhydrase family protein [Aquabacterium sp.]
MLPTLAFPRLTALALLAGLALSLTSEGVVAADAPASSESGASASIRPTLDKPTFFKRKEAVKETPKSAAKPKPEAQGVSMSELADLIDQKIAEVAAKRAAAPVVKVKTAAPRAKRVAAVSGAALASSVAVQDPLQQRLLLGTEVDWAYSGATGPDAWGQLKPAYRQCMLGKRQSPIDIRDGLPVHLDPIQFDYRPTRFRVIDTGRTVQVKLDLGNSITVMGQRYELVQMQFHRPSEERVNGRAYPMSAQLLHKSPAGQIAVVAVLLDQGEPHALIQQVWNNLPLEKHQEQAAQLPMDPSQILPLPAQRYQYYTYMGSLTSPPCTENVLWMVMKQPVTVSIEQIDLFHRLYPMNARPVQPTAGRMIKDGL